MDDVKKMLEKKQKKKKASEKLDKIDATLQEYYANLPSPKLTDSLPYRLFMWLIGLIVGLPSLIKSSLAKKEKTDNEEEDEELKAQLLTEQEYQKRKAQASQLHKELNPKKIEKSDSAAPVITYNLTKPQTNQESEQKFDPNSGSKEWTDKQKADLIKVFRSLKRQKTNDPTKKSR